MFIDDDGTRAISAGGVVYTYDTAGQLLLLLIKDKHGNWTLPKGHLHADETPHEAAHREIIEETGLENDIGLFVGRVAYPILKRGLPSIKTVDFFLAHADYIAPTPQLDEGISQARWLRPVDALALVSYNDMHDILQHALDLLDSE
ncbi:MAG: NUDIX hydrolase [Chloroflexaceae bacterium]|nr:NUDIX hydrolase [Chloroflexaceae bacterium]NJO05689.1 NUDIX hydrolase [Chloroflexaceae bacterium]